MFLNLVVLISKCRQLWQVSDAEYLMRARQSPELPPNNRAHPSPDSLIDLVKDQRRRAILLRQYALQPQHQPGGLASGSNFHQRFEPLTGIGRDQKLQFVQS